MTNGRGSGGVLREHVAEWTRPAIGAIPIEPYPLNSILRALLAIIFVVYWRAGQIRDIAPWDTVIIVALVAILGAAEVGFWRAHRDPGRLLRTWAWVLPADVLVLVTAGALDNTELSPIPLLAVATLFTASAMFQARYTIALALFAGVGVVAAHAAVDLHEQHLTALAPFLITTVLLGTGGFAASRGRTEEALRARLLDAQRSEVARSAELLMALDAARTSEARFDALLEYAPALILVGDRRTNSIFVSRQVRQMFGDPGRTFDDVLSWSETLLADGAPVAAALVKAMAGESTSLEFRATDLVGAKHDLAAVFFAMENGVGLIARDVSEERTLAAQVARAQQMETLGTLAGGVAHDFNNLLTAILGNIYLVRQDLPPDSDLLPMLDDAQRAGERGADLVRRLLAYGRPTVERTERVDLARLMTETAALAQRTLTPQIRLRIETPPEESSVNGNFGSLQQVLLNLMINARDAMPDGGVLTLSSSPQKLSDGATEPPPGIPRAITTRCS